MPGYSHLHEDLCGVVEQVYQFLGEMSIVWNCRGNGGGLQGELRGDCRGTAGGLQGRGESGEVAGLLADPVCFG